MSLIPITDRMVVPCSRHSVVSKNEIIILFHWISHTLSTSYLWKSQESPFQQEMRNCDVKKKACLVPIAKSSSYASSFAKRKNRKSLR